MGCPLLGSQYEGVLYWARLCFLVDRLGCVSVCRLPAAHGWVAAGGTVECQCSACGLEGMAQMHRGYYAMQQSTNANANSADQPMRGGCWVRGSLAGSCLGSCLGFHLGFSVMDLPERMNGGWMILRSLRVFVGLLVVALRHLQRGENVFLVIIVGSVNCLLSSCY